MVREDLKQIIQAQQGKEGTAVHTVGLQLLDMLDGDKAGQELVLQDLQNPDMGLKQCEAKIKAYADQHRQGVFAFVAPSLAEAIIREFFGLPQRGRAEHTQAQAAPGGLPELEDFLL